MSEMPAQERRSQQSKPDEKGVPTFDWSLTRSTLTDEVRLVTGPFEVLPVIFVPGIMGSNLKSASDGKPVWRLDVLGRTSVPWTLAKEFVGKPAGARQTMLHPDRVVVDSGGAVPGKNGTERKWYADAGWGEIAEGSYQSYLRWLEDKLNPVEPNPARWRDYFQNEATWDAPPKPGAEPKLFPGIKMGLESEPFGAEKAFESILTDDLIARSKFRYPIYAFGYNWLASNTKAGDLLSQRISQLVTYYNKGVFRCQQVLLVTHSMGGLVARACAKLPGMADKIAGVVHGVMPSVGAAVAYRRCKVGLSEESLLAGWVIGSTGREVTAVFAQAPGALQLLPSKEYAPNWLKVSAQSATSQLSLPAAGGDPYDSIYLERRKWWGLVDESWLSPDGGTPIRWNQYADAIDAAREFHVSISGFYHPVSYVYYGADAAQKSFEKVTWRIKPGLHPDNATPPNISSISGLNRDQIRTDGTSPEFVGGRTEITTYYGELGGGVSVYDTSYWELHCEMQDGMGDGTVPVSSGSAPKKIGGSAIKQQFRMSGFDHEGSYKNPVAQRSSLYALTKIVGVAKRST